MKSINTYAFIGLSVSLLSMGSQFASASAGGGRVGGGTGCLAEIMSAALSTSKLLDSAKNLPVKGETFLAQVNPNIFQFTQDNLQYEGNPVDAFFNGSMIQVRCDRFEANTPQGQERVLAHEIFRKMGIEGDNYEISSQIPGLSNLLVNGVYQNLQDPTDRLIVDVEPGLGANNFVITMIPTWSPMVYSCSERQCTAHRESSDSLYFYHEDLIISLLGDGNFIFQSSVGTCTFNDGRDGGPLAPSPLKKYIYVGK